MTLSIATDQEIANERTVLDNAVNARKHTVMSTTLIVQVIDKRLDLICNIYYDLHILSY